MLHVLRHEQRDVHIKTDSDYVLKGCLKHRFAWATLGWHKVSNADLWQQAHALLSHRGSSVALSKVKGHAIALDVCRGRVSARDKHGNDGADHLASAAAAANSLPQQVVEEALHRKQVVRDVQFMMTEILSARSKQVFPSDASSDHGESMSCTS